MKGHVTSNIKNNLDGIQEMIDVHHNNKRYTNNNKQHISNKYPDLDPQQVVIYQDLFTQNSILGNNNINVERNLRKGKKHSYKCRQKNTSSKQQAEHNIDKYKWTYTM